MDIINFKELFTREGKWALESAMAFEPREKDFLSEFGMLAKRFPRETARTALTIAILRGEAEKKFPYDIARALYFTREALEQSTPWAVSQHRAQRYAGQRHIYDLGCSIGGDTVALAKVAPTTGIDTDALRLQMAKANAKALRVKAEFIQADVQTLPLEPDSAIFADPARRKDGKRAFSVEDYTPPLSIIKTWQGYTDTIGIKISPGVQLDELSTYDCEVEFISLKGELKEAMLWFGPLKRTSFRATLLDNDGNLHEMLREGESPTIPITEPAAYIYEPDPAILRAGLVTDLGAQINAAQLDPEIAYLTSDTLTETPFARVWQVEDWLPFQLKRLRTYLRERNVGRVTVKKRGSPLTPEQLIQDLRLEGEEEKVLFLTQLEGKPIVVIASV